MLLDFSRGLRRKMNSIGHFRSSVWDPVLLLTQILSMQFIFYTSLGFWIILFDFFTGSYRSLDQLFRYQVRGLRYTHSRLTDFEIFSFLRL